jgi:hypothetical protein
MPTFTTKHYRKLAEVFGDIGTTSVKTGPGKLYWDAIHYFNVIDSLCIMFQEDNENFDRRLFLKAIECPYFDEVRMGVPVIVKHCLECNVEFLLFMEDNPDQTVCDKCKRRFESE